MKRLLLLPLFVTALALAGCAGTPFGDAVRVATSTYTNPVGPTNIYQAKIVYAATLELATSYREYCYKRPYAVLMVDPVAKVACKNRRSIVRSMQAADTKAYAAIITADNFVRQNPTVNATGLISAAVAAVTNFQNLASSYATAAIPSK